jgi:mannose-6-phosphate isomerase-like protein (cupin superfamily)
MPSTSTAERSLVLELRHTGERLVIHRARDGRGVEELHLAGSLPAGGEGPPLHIHAFEDEHAQVVSGTLSASLDGKNMTVGPGGSVRFPKGSAHRWWNAGDDELVLRGTATPAVDLDRFLHALFEVLNAGSGRPPIFYLAHVLYRHRKTQTILVMPRIVRSVMLPIAVLIGTVVGKYRGTAWPGCPERCVGAPQVDPHT